MPFAISANLMLFASVCVVAASVAAAPTAYAVCAAAPLQPNPFVTVKPAALVAVSTVIFAVPLKLTPPIVLALANAVAVAERKFATSVVDAITNGAVPVETVEVICPVALMVVKAPLFAVLLPIFPGCSQSVSGGTNE